jgi:hypothetical protein
MKSEEKKKHREEEEIRSCKSSPRVYSRQSGHVNAQCRDRACLLFFLLSQHHIRGGVGAEFQSHGTLKLHKPTPITTDFASIIMFLILISFCLQGKIKYAKNLYTKKIIKLITI